MVHAINKQGREAFFTERVWDLLPKGKNGWVEFSAQGEVLIPSQIVEFQKKKADADVVKSIEIEAPAIEQPEAVIEPPMPKEPAKPKVTKIIKKVRK